MELRAESFKRAETDSLPDSTHQVNVKVEVMDSVERPRRHLSGHEEMTEVGAAEVPAGITAAGRFRGLPRLRALGVFDHEGARTRQQLPVSRLARPQRAVEHV